ncbi:MAG: acyl-CoA/acyl-ACP dehydrogenase [Chloroflexi bacterium]|nr:acyl-CoA/acyl-ACP dehydrogenase [Chloroflexota bacterium]MCI0817480.1 acyl-CoA/acyl-ACP dehydrogenase [Chloroflexota bacterium]MCI0819112.1 acyl-CoA/acyl-ACP dehydrogenase [Chloroflexota bacterium]
MDLGLDEQQEMLKNFARDFLEKECPESLVREMEEDDQGYSPDLWKKMAEQGWMGLIIPEDQGGAAMTLCELVVLLEEFGRALVPGPFISTVVLGAVPIMEAGTDEQKAQYLPKIAAGELIMTMALTEPSAKWTADGVTLEAKKDGGDYVLNGTKLFVPDAHVTDHMVVVARTGGKGEDGITLFIVDSKSDGIKFEQLKTIAADKQSEVIFENVKVPAANVLGDEGKGWETVEKVSRVATVAACAYLVGLSQMDFDTTLNYAKERVQFGRPIGSFQAIQHKLADAIIDVDGSRFITYKAAWSLTEGEDDTDMMISMAKAWASDASRRVVAHGQQIHGGIGFTKEYKIQLYFRRQKWMELMWGDADYHREKVAQLMEV